MYTVGLVGGDEEEVWYRYALVAYRLESSQQMVKPTKSVVHNFTGQLRFAKRLQKVCENQDRATRCA